MRDHNSTGPYGSRISQLAGKVLAAKAKLLVTAAVAASVSGVTVAATVSTFSAETAHPANGFATGNLVLGDSVNGGTVCLSTGGGTADTNSYGHCATMFDLAARKPGDPASANLTLQNKGSLPAADLQLYAGACNDSDGTGESYHGTASPCGAVQLTIQQWTDATFAVPAHCIYGGGDSTTCDWSHAADTLGGYATAHGSAASAQSIGTGLAPGASGYFTIAVRLPTTAANTLQGRAASEDFTWRIVQ